jgi:hypothetical protein
MDGMNEWLADFYGTGGNEDDLEKQAQAALLEKLAEDGDIDLDSLDENELAELAEALGVEGDEDDDITDHQKVAMISKVAEANEIDLDSLDEDQFNELAEFALDPSNWEDEGDDEIDKEAEAKFAEADFLGRVMAHSQVAELNRISDVMDKEAGPRTEAVKEFMKSLGKGSTYRKAGRAVKRETVGRAKGSYKSLRAAASGTPMTGVGTLSKAERIKALKSGLMRGAPLAGGAAVLGGGGTYAAMRKRSSADFVEVGLDEDAINLLAAAGYEFE